MVKEMYCHLRSRKQSQAETNLSNLAFQVVLMQLIQGYTYKNIISSSSEDRYSYCMKDYFLLEYI